MLPIVIITSAEAMRAVPQSLREAGYGVGATRWEVTRHHVLPYALPGVITGTVLALARAIGEAAPLLLCGAATGLLPGKEGLLDLSQLEERFTALPIVIAEWARTPREGFDEIAAAAILVMLVIVLVHEHGRHPAAQPVREEEDVSLFRTTTNRTETAPVDDRTTATDRAAETTDGPTDGRWSSTSPTSASTTARSARCAT